MRMKALALLGMLVAMVLCAHPATAWEPVGPSAGAIRSLAWDAAGGVLYAGTYGGGLFKSTDRSASWTAIAPAIRDQSISALALHPSAPRTLFAGTYSDGVWRSNDGGATWKRVLFGGTDIKDQHATFTAIAIDPANPRIVHAATDTGPNDGVWRSADGGDTWVRNRAGLPDNYRLTSLAFEAGSSSTLYVATMSDGVYRSTDAGRTWSATHALLQREVVQALATGSAPGTVLAGTTAGIFVTNDSGATWVPVADGLKRRPNVHAIAVDPNDPAVLWAGASNALLRSIDGGRRWKDTMPDLEYATVRALAFDVKAGSVFAGVTRDGVVRSDDGGATWTRPGTGLFALDVQGIATDPASPGTMWVASTVGVWRTTDAGRTWALASGKLANRSNRCVVRDPASRTLYACTGDGVWRSADNGDTWAKMQSGLSFDTKMIGIALDPATPDTLYAREPSAVFRSTDRGVTWTRTSTDLEISGTINGLFALAAPAGMPGVVFASVYRHFWKSSDGATTFAKSGAGLPLARVQAVVGDAKGLLAGTDGEGVYRSADGGATWTATRGGMGNAHVQAMVVDPARPEVVYAATWRNGLYRSTDGGRNWAAIGGKPPHPDAITLALDPGTPGAVLVGFSGGSVWRVDGGVR